VAALAFIKDMNERNANMQYLECLSAALCDMAQTYQPAERMSAVLRAVMVELRGGSGASQSRLYKPIAAAVPARRGTTNDTDECEQKSQVWKKPYISRPDTSTGASTDKPRGSSSMSTPLSTPVENHSFNIAVPSPARSGDATRINSHSIVTPNAEPSASWHMSTEPVELSHGMSTFRATPSSFHPGHNEAWMATEFTTNDPMSHPTPVHFPEMETFHGEHGGVEGMTSHDTMNLGEGGNWDIEREWAGLGTDYYGFSL
jgi:hypothetical protein